MTRKTTSPSSRKLGFEACDNKSGDANTMNGNRLLYIYFNVNVSYIMQDDAAIGGFIDKEVSGVDTFFSGEGKFLTAVVDKDTSLGDMILVAATIST